jgi:hypothetical protein
MQGVDAIIQNRRSWHPRRLSSVFTRFSELILLLLLYNNVIVYAVLGRRPFGRRAILARLNWASKLYPVTSLLSPFSSG